MHFKAIFYVFNSYLSFKMFSIFKVSEYVFYLETLSLIISKLTYKGVDPAFRLMRFPLDGELDFNLKNNFYWLKKWLGVATYFCFIFKGVNKIRKKTLSVTP